MKVLYIAKHDSGGGDDEGSITHALTELGHHVERLRENRGNVAYRTEADLVLFHGWYDISSLSKIKTKKVFWHFDLIDYPDGTLRERCRHRINWMRNITEHVDLGFCTDGDWVVNDRTRKLVKLTQGADERILGRGNYEAIGRVPPLLFTGIRRGGRDRQDFVDFMTNYYGISFNHVLSGTYREDLANLIAASKIVVGPEAPITDRYWSNRVYTTLGFGGFLLHRYSRGLAEHYEDGREIVYYRNRNELLEKIDYYLAHPEERERISTAALERTRNEHTYKHRCAELIRVVRERLGIRG